MRFSLSFKAQGKRFRPSKVSYAFAKQHDVGDLATRGRYKGGPYPYGASSIKVPDDIPWEEKIPTLVAIVTSLREQMREEGAESFYVSAGYYYDSQCNLEFTPKELALLASLDCSFCPSCYQEEESQNKALELRWLRKTGPGGSLTINPKTNPRHVQEKPTQVQPRI